MQVSKSKILYLVNCKSDGQSLADVCATFALNAHEGDNERTATFFVGVIRIF